MSEYTDHILGSYTSNGAARTLELPFLPSSFELFVQGNAAGDIWDSVANPGELKRAWWFRGMANGTALGVYNTDGAATDQSTFLATGGVTPIEVGQTTLGAAQTGTGISQAAAAVVTVNGHGLSTGDFVLISGATGMLQLSNYVFQVTVLNANTFSIPVDSSGFAAPATAVVIRRVFFPDLYIPNNKYITAITAAGNAVVSFSTPHNFVVGERIRLNVPDLFGMIQADGVIAEVTAVGALTVTLDLNSSAFTAFAFPTSANAAGSFTLPQAYPDSTAGSNGTLNARFTTSAFRGVNLGAAVAGENGALVLYKAYKDSVIT